jgi:uncharacterized protein (TIGR03792 family)
MYSLGILPVADQMATQAAAYPVEQLVAMEYLRVKVLPEEVDRFVQADRDIWTTFLSQQPGFLHKQVLCSKTTPGEVVILTQWRSREEWKSIPQDLLNETDRKFTVAMGRSVPFTETGEYMMCH